MPAKCHWQLATSRAPFGGRKPRSSSTLGSPMHRRFDGHAHFESGELDLALADLYRALSDAPMIAMSS